MKHLKLFLYAAALAMTLSACGGDDEDDPGNGGGGNTTTTTANTNANTGEGQNALAKLYVNNLEVPHLKGGSNNIMIVHIANGLGLNFCTEWDTGKRAQRWSCFSWHDNNSDQSTKRKPSEKNGDFTEYPNDPDLPSKYHFTADPYYGSGFDHGHIMASADRSYAYNEAANRQTFYMTNMQPQLNGFNAAVWANMEAQARKWNTKNFRDTLFVVKGGTIDSEANLYEPKPYIGSDENRIPVPKYFFMAFLCKKPKSMGGGYEAAAFWIEHKVNYSDELLKYVISIDELEEKTGIDFFCNLPDDIENSVERTIGSSFKVGLK